MPSDALPPASDAPTERWLEIQPQGWRLPLPPGLSLLEAAQQAGVRLARSCRNGTCRACRCQLLAGEVRYRVEWPGISAEERAEGLILPCVAEALGDVCIDAPAAQRP
ncbi:MAG TPA: 2Fe-2S iron-sulfur cluster-binding protein [Ideonella sp.]|uniref:2Fe-2S iron-sulfur cluster-binding protein n=1 Tax=Ideonella sp. TaxID=1929293 RepID=UPI002C0D1F55|nr:2Fe-2S iron-sulfur cluster-binding protein [Ideonella sp.]HSI49898.1 2Fe-2S iron-sulfur cluster-binding protein [Ideonella sp.]